MSKIDFGQTVTGTVLVDDGQFDTALQPPRRVTGRVVGLDPNLPGVARIEMSDGEHGVVKVDTPLDTLALVLDEVEVAFEYEGDVLVVVATKHGDRIRIETDADPHYPTRDVYFILAVDSTGTYVPGTSFASLDAPGALARVRQVIEVLDLWHKGGE